MLEIINANVYALYKANITLKGSNASNNPWSNVAGGTMPVMVPANLPPQIPSTPAIITSMGITTSAATIFGSTRYVFELMPIISNASICSLTLILPNSREILLPTTPAKTIQTNVGANSRITVSLTTCAITDKGISGLTS